MSVAWCAEVTASLRLYVPVVHLHVNDLHELDLGSKFLDFFLKIQFQELLILNQKFGSGSLMQTLSSSFS